MEKNNFIKFPMIRIHLNVDQVINDPSTAIKFVDLFNHKEFVRGIDDFEKTLDFIVEMFKESMLLKLKKYFK